MNNSNPKTIDLHRLEPRFAGTRLMVPRVVEQLARSMDGGDQLMACVVVCESDGGPLILIDGYHRVAALRRLGRDTVKIEQWDCNVTEALIKLLTLKHGRPFDALEEALLLREIQSSGVSQRDMAARCGRDVSWVCRRLQLLSFLSDDLISAIADGTLSSWSATRVLVPLARANPTHAAELLKALRKNPLTTRELSLWFEHYQKSLFSVRQSMVDKPHLFLAALRENDVYHQGERLRKGPEGECEGDVRTLEKVLARLKKHVAVLHPIPTVLLTSIPQLRTTFDALVHTVEKEAA